MTNCVYVYLLTSINNPEHHYTGLTENLELRISNHNAGEVPHTKKYLPWRLETAIIFTSREKAISFEKYLKSHSGRAFAIKHF